MRSCAGNILPLRVGGRMERMQSDVKRWECCRPAEALTLAELGATEGFVYKSDISDTLESDRVVV